VIGDLQSVIDYQDGRASWATSTPAGRTIEWDTTITKYLPRSVIAWENTRESDVRLRATVRLTPLSPTRTRLLFEISYHPPREGVRDAVHSLFIPARERQLEADLEHTRIYLESHAPFAQS
jgi:uncharacterized membrane protein